MKKKVLFIFAVLLGMAQAGLADLLTPSGAIAGTWYDSGDPVKYTDRAPTRMIDGTGLIFVGAAGEEGVYTNYQYIPCPNDFGSGTSWTGDEPAGGSADDLWAIVDLGSICTIETISLFNFNPKRSGVNPDRETQKLDIWVREDGGFSNSNLDGVAFNTNGWTLLTVANDMTLAQYAGGTTQSVAGVLSSLADVQGRYVALDVNSNFGHGSFSLIGEVQVFGELYVPESDLINAVSAYSNFEAYNNRAALNLINGTGLLFTGVAGEEGDYKKYLYNYCDSAYGEGTEWLGIMNTEPTIDDMWVVVDLGSVCELNALSIFNFNPLDGTTVSRSVKDLDVWIREDIDLNNIHTNGVAFNTNGWTLVTVSSDMSLNQNPGGTTQTVSNVLGLNGISGRMIALDINSNYGVYNMCGLGEIQVFGNLSITNTVRVVPVDAIAYSEIVFDGRSVRAATNTINGSGLDFIGEVGQEGDYSKYQYLPGPSAHGEYYDWVAQAVSGDSVDDMWLVYDLGSVRELKALSIFNFNPATDEVISRSVKSLDVWVRSDAGFSNTHLDETTFDSSGWTLVTPVNDMHLIKNPGGTTQTVHNVLGFADVSARYIALDINENYGYANIPALGEALFFCEPLPPVPKGTMILLQ
ncbi:MAG: hypothetical protein PF904_15090 [Kiritimatiellae bacterium]|nr:hypothetical protein [Kiritimatiellia bacterium]